MAKLIGLLQEPFDGWLRPTHGPKNRHARKQVHFTRLARGTGSPGVTAKNSRVVLFRKPVYNATDYTVALTPSRPFALTRKAELVIRGNPPNGLRDSQGHLIDGNHDGHPGGNAITLAPKKLILTLNQA